MNNATTIRIELENLMIKNGYSMAQLARSTHLNPGTVSAILSGNRTLSMDELDRITSVMELPKGHFYERYFEEYLVDLKPNWTRISSILYHSVELDNLDLFEKVVTRFKDKINYASSLFEIAEDLFENGKMEGAAFLYQAVAENEKNQYSERLAKCQYRIFLIKQGDNQQQNYQAASQFEPFAERLNELDQLDALKDLANTYRSLRRWYKVEEIVTKLKNKAHYQYHRKRDGKCINLESLKSPKRPLFFYLAYSSLLMAGVFEARGDYTNALQCTYAYADLSWVKEDDEQTLHWKNLFREWAVANTYGNKLLSGDFEILPEYLDYIQNNEDEILPALVNIMEAANRFNQNVDPILHKFETELKRFISKTAVGMYTEYLIVEYMIYLFYEIADYYLNHNIYSKGYDFLVSCLEKSASTNNKSYIIMCVGLFESFRDKASSEIIAIYQRIIKGVSKNEKGNRFTLFGG
ncbi:helix-turn-helix domain-containing protein [Paenibacillus polymyxa]|uniref:helix-turn-helix domain-containing protein n=1 Tax=Paenibacillus polymyxa TaxID=1406 RepID=UPI0032169ADF